MPTITIGGNTGDDFTGLETGLMREGGFSGVADPNGGFLVTRGPDGTNGRASWVKVTGLTNIPSGATITAAALYVNNEFAFGTTANLYRCLRAATTGCTDVNYDGTNAWTSACGFGDGTDRVATASGTGTASGTDVYNAYTGSGLIDDIQDMVDGVITNNGWLWQNTDGFQTEWRGVGATDGRRPYLEVTYTEGGGGGGSGGRMGLLGAGRQAALVAPLAWVIRRRQQLAREQRSRSVRDWLRKQRA